MATNGRRRRVFVLAGDSREYEYWIGRSGHLKLPAYRFNYNWIDSTGTMFFYVHNIRMLLGVRFTPADETVVTGTFVSRPDAGRIMQQVELLEALVPEDERILYALERLGR